MLRKYYTYNGICQSSNAYFMANYECRVSWLCNAINYMKCYLARMLLDGIVKLPRIHIFPSASHERIQHFKLTHEWFLNFGIQNASY